MSRDDHSTGGIEHEVLNEVKWASEGVERDRVAREFNITKTRASDILRSLRYKGHVKFSFETGLFHYVTTGTDKS